MQWKAQIMNQKKKNFTRNLKMQNFHIFQFEFCFSFCVSCFGGASLQRKRKKKEIYNDLIPYINTIKYIILFLVYSLHVFCHVLLVYIVYSTVFIYCFLSILHFCFPQCFPFSVNNLNSGDWIHLNDKKDSLATNVIHFRFIFTSLSIDNPFMTSKWEGTIY